MTEPSDDVPPLLAVLDLFVENRTRTLESVAEELNVSEEAAMEALERLEDRHLLVRARGGTETPVWKPHGDTDPEVFQQD